MTAGGIFVTQTYFLNSSWRVLLWVSIASMSFFALIPSVLIDLGIVRNQYFYAGAPLVNAFAAGMYFIVNVRDGKLD